ncbi:unnamed protein product [Clonostachys solani]|uniref:Uncharacterized protein n=1 Tax=Clonostachys solani TaxID=160281 RepID=A0A9N9ZGY1_9HYPO|nr:unnamed protein product [Clonostachys solani]
MDRNNAKEVYKYYRQVLAPYFSHRAPNIDGKLVLNSLPSDANDINEDNSPLLDKDLKLKSLLSQETIGCGRLKALYYKDIQMLIVWYLITGWCIPTIAIKFIYHKGANKKPKLYIIFYFTPTRKILFYTISTIITLALYNNAFNIASLIDIKSIFRLKLLLVILGDTLDTICDQIIHHNPQFMTFHHTYLNEIANFNIQNAFLKEEKEI